MELHACVESPVGPILLSADSSGHLTGLRFGSGLGDLEMDRHSQDEATPEAKQVLKDSAAQLGEYFARRRRCFEVPLALEGSPFQQEVWALVRDVPYGTTVSYGQLAARLGRPRGARAVGHANARNPVAVIVPCHRVIGASGRLTGYGGGLDAKRRLLSLEAQPQLSRRTG